MKKHILPVMILVFLLVGCVQQEEKPSTVHEPIKVDVQREYKNMIVIEISEEIIIIAPPADNPEASYPVYEMKIDEDTKVEGSIDEFNLISVGDVVSIWVEETDDINTLIAEKIEVQ
ncbi:hypothetical protein BTS2_2472 [Bacillus sp. TS-2]|nr:hypothetical protein BTS2_2472 [Bacillus sp. TS-2]